MKRLGADLINGHKTTNGHDVPGKNGRTPAADHFRHGHAIIEPGASVGAGTRIWAFAHVLAGAVVGADCNLCDHTFIEGAVRIGDRVTIKCGVSLWDGVEVGDDVFIGPHAVFTNDLRPRSRVYPAVFPRTKLLQGCSLGANCTILPGLTIGRWALIGAGAVVTHDVPDFGLVFGVPARLRGWVCQCGNKLKHFTGSRWNCACGRTFKLKAANQLCELESVAAAPTR
jgi:acetyltransferase-like isoleucine patch superfamily enzyme